MDVPGADVLGAVVVGAVVKAVALSLVGRSLRSRFVQIGTVSELHLYPVKSCGALSVSDALATPVGLCSGGITDRHWIIIDKAGRKINMKDHPPLSCVTSSTRDDVIVLRAPGMPDLEMPVLPDVSYTHKLTQSQVAGEPRVSPEESTIPAVDCGTNASKWISTYIGRPASLYYSNQDLGTRNVIDHKRDWDNNARDTDVALFSYLTSYLVTSTASLRDLNKQLASPVSSINFRPNIVIDNLLPYDEDNWRQMRIGDNVLLHSVEPCLRCMITTIDPATGTKSKDLQPLKLLRSYRMSTKYKGGPVFGNYMSLDITGKVKVGDPVFVLRS